MKQHGMRDTLIIVAGDCGFGFEREGYYEGIYKRCSRRLSKNNNWLPMSTGLTRVLYMMSRNWMLSAWCVPSIRLSHIHHRLSVNSVHIKDYRTGLRMT